MRRFIPLVMAAAALASPIVVARGADAGDRPVLVELYTSQGCSSCPPADALLHQLAAREDVIALAFHVDYWDYIFDDLFGKAAHTKRQYGYAAASGRDMVYTPQMVIGGQDAVVGNRPRDVTEMIDRHLAAPDHVALSLSREGGQMVIEAEADAGFVAPLIVQVAQYLPERTVSIDHGENAGHTYSYMNIVTDLSELGRWDPAQPLSMKVRVPQDAKIAVILQRPGYGPVEAAALLE
ncbi:DUF1223 domain-containing protein [Roseovarius aquimarinus]|uniref:DUF1223 domain-containing protein n=1 Tax=Roseovarius aquimarinus TaxID=1229156 RepID=A0ABW7IBF8_9RHOB